jgi:hypothetical protein
VSGVLVPDGVNVKIEEVPDVEMPVTVAPIKGPEVMVTTAILPVEVVTFCWILETT